ncbi:MAG TPA: hypothetical protein VKU02_17860 [Gemmataceae bacterium]|nr:hypothetical protein [Gemmataceae bacterium]
MLRLLLLALGVLLGTDVSLLAQPRRGGGQARDHGWIFSLEEGKALARTSGKPLMVVLRCEP